MTTKEETFTYLSGELAEIQQDAQALQTLSAESSFLQDRIDDLLKKADSVRDDLSSNPYVRVSGFSVTIPWGVTFEFSFPEDERQ